MQCDLVPQNRQTRYAISFGSLGPCFMFFNVSATVQICLYRPYLGAPADGPALCLVNWGCEFESHRGRTFILHSTIWTFLCKW